METLLRAMLIAVLCAMPWGAASGACDLASGGGGRVADVPDAETLVLEDGRTVRLVNMISPRRPLWLPGGAIWAAAQAAHAALVLLAEGRAVTLSVGGRETDRHGRLLAHVFVTGTDTAPGVWVQSAMIAQGRARVTSAVDNGACVGDLLAVERAARAAGRGVWADPHYRVYSAEEVDALARLLNQFHLVEGVVRAVESRGSRTYVNFAEDWRSDFTAIVAGRDRRRFTAEGIDLEALAGRRVRVRGFVRTFNGPAIDMTHPGQLEILDADE